MLNLIVSYVVFAIQIWMSRILYFFVSDNLANYLKSYLLFGFSPSMRDLLSSPTLDWASNKLEITLEEIDTLLPIIFSRKEICALATTTYLILSSFDLCPWCVLYKEIYECKLPDTESTKSPLMKSLLYLMVGILSKEPLSSLLELRSVICVCVSD